jgi:hypothetical protein
MLFSRPFVAHFHLTIPPPAFLLHKSFVVSFLWFIVVHCLCFLLLFGTPTFVFFYYTNNIFFTSIVHHHGLGSLFWFGILGCPFVVCHCDGFVFPWCCFVFANVLRCFSFNQLLHIAFVFICCIEIQYIVPLLSCCAFLLRR